jgi:hypothetical protein
MNNYFFSKEEVLAIIKWQQFLSFTEGKSDAFYVWMADEVSSSGKKEYSSHDVYVLMHADPDTTPVGDVKKCICD